MRWLIAVLAVVGLLLGAGGTAHASQPEAASGTFTVSAITSFSLRPAGQIAIIEQTTTGVFAGTLTGTFEDAIKAVVNPTANKVVQGLGAGTCVCTVEGKSGTVDYVFSSRGPFDGQSFLGRMVISGGTGDLSGLHGVLDLDGTVDQNGLATVNYEGQFHHHQ